MLSRKQGRSFPTPDFAAGLAPSRQPSHGRRPRLELRNGRNGGNGPHAKSTNRTDLRTALLHSQDADAGAMTTRSQPLKISFQLLYRAPYNFIGSKFSQPLYFLRKKTRENGRNVHALDSTSRGARERLRDGVGRRGGEHREAQRGVEEGGGGRQVQRLPN